MGLNLALRDGKPESKRLCYDAAYVAVTDVSVQQTHHVEVYLCNISNLNPYSKDKARLVH
jgi:hypothetical protein